MNKSDKKVYASNKVAYHDYFIRETLECGIVLAGNEVKSIRAGRVNLKGSWCDIHSNELFIEGMFVSRWETVNDYDYLGERRERKLLASKREISKLFGQVQQKGFTLVPLEVYSSGRNVKVLIGLAEGKHNYDKRQSEKIKTMKRDMERSL